MIKIEELKFSYGKDKQILHGLNFEVKLRRNIWNSWA
ncbi:ABC transporter multidrug-family ATP-binding protein [Clostridioides difficile]|nr:ABC transporter multidrug-family ATP-binding protein [Clostridioides difficile]